MHVPGGKDFCCEHVLVAAVLLHLAHCIHTVPDVAKTPIEATVNQFILPASAIKLAVLPHLNLKLKIRSCVHDLRLMSVAAPVGQRLGNRSPSTLDPSLWRQRLAVMAIL